MTNTEGRSMIGGQAVVPLRSRGRWPRRAAAFALGAMVCPTVESILFGLVFREPRHFEDLPALFATGAVLLILGGTPPALVTARDDGRAGWLAMLAGITACVAAIWVEQTAAYHSPTETEIAAGVLLVAAVLGSAGYWTTRLVRRAIE